MRKRFVLLYGSQTGQAEAISEQIRDQALSKGLSPELHCLDKSEKNVTSGSGERASLCWAWGHMERSSLRC